MPRFWVSLFSEPISFLEISWKIPQEPNPCWLAFNMAQWGRSAMDIDWGVIMYRKEYVQFTTMIIPCLSHQNPLMFHPHSILLMVIFHSMRLSLKILENLAKSMCKLVKICQNPSNSYWFSHHCPTRISIIIPSLSIILPWKISQIARHPLPWPFCLDWESLPIKVAALPAMQSTIPSTFRTFLNFGRRFTVEKLLIPTWFLSFVKLVI